MTYEERQEARKALYEARAMKAEGRASENSDASLRALDGIVAGQPILVGHHSEKRHRAALRRSDNYMQKCHEEQEKAEYYRAKAESVGKGGISSDDENAIEKLREKLSALEHKQEFMKKTNKIIRSNKSDQEKIEALVELGANESQATDLILNQKFMGEKGFPSYALTNNNAKIRNTRARLERLEATTGKENKTYETEWGEIVLNYDENRLQIFHDSKPDVSIRKALKENGFKWSRYNTCWQRMLTHDAIYRATKALGIPEDLIPEYHNGI